jgi:hypothetical protein
MRGDRNRAYGFYWVRFEGEVIVAEYTDGDGCLEEVGGREVAVKPHWHVPGSDVCYKAREVCELLGPVSPAPGLQEGARRSIPMPTTAIPTANVEALPLSSKPDLSH